MAGSPIRRARRELGLPKPPAPLIGPMRARAIKMAEDIAPDPELFAMGKAVLVKLALDAREEKDRISAARALIEAARPRDAKAEGDGFLTRLPSDELMAEVAAAKRALGESGDGPVTQ